MEFRSSSLNRFYFLYEVESKHLSTSSQFSKVIIALHKGSSFGSFYFQGFSRVERWKLNALQLFIFSVKAMIASHYIIRCYLYPQFYRDDSPILSFLKMKTGDKARLKVS